MSVATWQNRKLNSTFIYNFSILFIEITDGFIVLFLYCSFKKSVLIKLHHFNMYFKVNTPKILVTKEVWIILLSESDISDNGSDDNPNFDRNPQYKNGSDTYDVTDCDTQPINHLAAYCPSNKPSLTIPHFCIIR